MAEEKDRAAIDIDRTALFLMRRYGDDSACIAHLRANWCERLGDAAAAADWRRVLFRVVQLHFAPRTGPLN